MKSPKNLFSKHVFAVFPYQIFFRRVGGRCTSVRFVATRAFSALGIIEMAELWICNEGTKCFLDICLRNVSLKRTEMIALIFTQQRRSWFSITSFRCFFSQHISAHLTPAFSTRAYELRLFIRTSRFWKPFPLQFWLHSSRSRQATNVSLRLWRKA